MGKFWYKHDVLCHWCGMLFESKRSGLQTRFCLKACKQAHYRAYKKYVTAKTISQGKSADHRVTQKKSKH